MDNQILLIILLVLTVIVLFVQLANISLKPKPKRLIKSFLFKKRSKKDKDKFETFAADFESGITNLSRFKIGAIVAIEKNISLERFIELGAKVNADFSAELMFSIFESKRSPLHDGGLIIRNYKMVCASAYFPNTSKIIDSKYGSRHRAALGLSEEFDCFTIIVSETDGSICYCYDGKLITIKPTQVAELLKKHLKP